jgi:hypothetical protein
MSKNKNQDLQPWLDYFKMFQQYEQKGFLQMNPQEHEAYITRAALLTLVPEVESFKFQVSRNDAQQEPETRNLKPETNDKALVALLSRLRAYAVWLEAALPTPATEAAAADPSAISQFPLSRLPVAFQPSYISAPFAVHIVKEDYPHDLLLTLLLQQKRSWYGRRKETIEVIDYTENLNNNKQ